MWTFYVLNELTKHYRSVWEKPKAHPDNKIVFI